LLESSPAHSRLGVLQDHLQARIAEVLQMAPGSVLRADQPLAELGLDSLMALELKNGIQKELEISLPANFFFEYPTLEMAATFVSARLVTAPRSARPQKDSSEYEELAF
jgi:myxalamid-type polyketide synthase MxaB